MSFQHLYWQVARSALCLPPSVMGEVYCFPRRQLIFSFFKRVISFERPLRVHSEIVSVCITIFELMVGLCLYPKSLMLHIDIFVTTSSAKSYIFTKFQIVFESMAENRKILKQIVRRKYWSKRNVLYINELVTTSSTNKLKAFLKISDSFSLLAENQKFIQMNS